MDLGSILSLLNLFFGIVVGLYFFNLLRSQQGSKLAVERESRKELDRLHQMREVQLTEPLAERVRPCSMQDIVGQEDGIRALRAALCGPNPQHVIVYGPPGVGKTAAARLVLEEAKRNPYSPFRREAQLIEMDATCARFDERGIADPLIGSVHDPIYQGAGAMGVQGIPQPKPGAVTKAHGGILFLDEIGELHPVQLNKLLKVLEDRKVMLESAYYNAEDSGVPAHIHDIFRNGLPADFRLVGATTRQPHEIPAALRSRCMEVFFRPLYSPDLARIVRNAGEKIGLPPAPGVAELICRYASSGREAVNIIQMSAGLAIQQGMPEIPLPEVEWVISTCHLSPRPDRQVREEAAIGVACGLAVQGPGVGSLLEIEVAVAAAKAGCGILTVTGVVDEEESQLPGRVLRRRGTARAAAENVLTALRTYQGANLKDYDIHLNFPGGLPVDGPSAGVTMAVVIASALSRRPVDHRLAMTGELSILGKIQAVGGVQAKLEAARRAGIERVLIPADNWQTQYERIPGLTVTAVRTLDEALDYALLPAATRNTNSAAPVQSPAAAVVAIATGAVPVT